MCTIRLCGFSAYIFILSFCKRYMKERPLFSYAVLEGRGEATSFDKSQTSSLNHYNFHFEYRWLVATHPLNSKPNAVSPSSVLEFCPRRWLHSFNGTTPACNDDSTYHFGVGGPGPKGCLSFFINSGPPCVRYRPRHACSWEDTCFRRLQSTVRRQGCVGSSAGNGGSTSY